VEARPIKDGWYTEKLHNPHRSNKITMKWTVLSLLSFSLCAAGDFSTGQAARLVIGQSPFSAQEQGASDRLLGAVGGVAYGANTLIISDSNILGALPNNNRVLIYNDVNGFVFDPRDTPPQVSGRCNVCVGKASVVLGQEGFDKTDARGATDKTLFNPNGVAYNGRFLAVADRFNNRVLIWRGLPATNQAPATFVVGQANFTTSTPSLSATGLRGPTGVWLDANDGLWVADTANDRVLYYGAITQNGQAARLVLGQSDFGVNQQLGKELDPVVAANSMRAPVSVTTDGTRLYVADLGLNRVLIWNRIPSSNGTGADVVLGQKDFSGRFSNNTPQVCEALNPDESDPAKRVYPSRCSASLSLPRYALSDGQRLFVADGGNDRVLVYRQIPVQNAAKADVILGQLDEQLNQSTDSGAPERVAAADSFKTPTSLAWDGTNLYVSDCFNRRVVVYTPGDFALPLTAVRNAPNPEVYASASVVFDGTIRENDEITLTIGSNLDKDEEGNPIEVKHTYKVRANDKFEDIIDGFVELINGGAGNPYALARPFKEQQALLLQARQPGPAGNQTTLSYTINPSDSLFLVNLSGSTFNGGQDAAFVAPYALSAILGDDLTDQTSEVQDLTKPLPTDLAGVEFFVDGLRAPLAYVSPTRIVAQLPRELYGSRTASGVLRVRRQEGTVQVSTAVAIRVIGFNPSIYSDTSEQPSPGLAFHLSSAGTATIDVGGGTMPKDNIAVVVIRGREHRYTIKENDTKEIVRDELVKIINENDPEVRAFAGGTFVRIRLQARIEGPEGNGIPISTRVLAPDGRDALDSGILLTAYNTQTCCANQAGAPVTEENPAVPGETIVVLASGLGVVGPDEAFEAMQNGLPYSGPALNDPQLKDPDSFVSSLAGGKTANVLFAGLRQGAVGVYEVHLELNPDLPTNSKTPLTIAQGFQVSNIVLVPVANPRAAAQ
jgi:hypothetical protein